MTTSTTFDLQAAHRFFAADCFNKAWGFIDKPSRTAEEEEEMLRLGFASYWHWTQRPDCTPGNLSISNWQLSRIYVILGRENEARRYALRCLEFSRGEGTLPFHLGYAYEALARAESLAGNGEKVKEYLDEAHQIARRMTDEEARKMLLADLETIR